MNKKMTAIIAREGDGYVALCPEVDVASQGCTVSEARDNLVEALALFFETASATETTNRLQSQAYVTHGKSFRISRSADNIVLRLGSGIEPGPVNGIQSTRKTAERRRDRR